MEIPFDDRSQAGRKLAERLHDLRDEDVVVLALPRGGVPIGLEIALRLRADLDVLLVRKIGVPGQEELALGAVGADGGLVVNDQIAAMVRADRGQLAAAAQALAPALAQRADDLRRGRPAHPIEGRVAVVVDDGIATGASMRAALEVVRSAKPGRLVVAVPVAPPRTCAELAAVADRVECLYQPEYFGAVGRWYRDFAQVTDDEVRRMLDVRPVAHGR